MMKPIITAFEDDDRYYPEAFLAFSSALLDEENSKCFINIINALLYL